MTTTPHEGGRPDEARRAQDGVGPEPGDGLDAGLDAELMPGLEDDLDADLDGELLGALAARLTPVDPAAGTREALLAAIAAEPTAQAAVPSDSPAASEAEDGSGGVIVELPRRRRLGRMVLRAAAAAVLVLAGIGIGRWTSMDSMAPTEHYAHLNQAQDVQRVTDTMPDGHIATLTWSQDMSMTALSLPEEMMAASQGHSLQVWLVKGGVVTSLGLYDPDNGTGFTFLDLMPEDGERILITQEPVGGSAQPTGDPLVTFDVNADGTTTRRPVTPATPTAAPQA